MIVQAPQYALATAFLRCNFRVAPEGATSLANGNQMQPVVMEALSVSQYQVLGCAGGANSECLETFVGH